ncbi:MAG: methylenetetrahydrofolate reductase C-terminal domain-containing protein [Clostridiales bacterium]
MSNKFKESLLDPGTFSVTWEIVPGRGSNEKAQVDAIETAKEAIKDSRIHAITITDCPGGNPAILAENLGKEVLDLGIEPLVHFTCKDKNRTQMESQLYAMARSNIRNLLVMTGDYVNNAYEGKAKPVFDIDPIHCCDLMGRMNQGLEYQFGTKTMKNMPTDFFYGCAVSPFKSQESELISQYNKLVKKIKFGGAKFIITQLGYDMRKFHEVLQFMKMNDLNVPLVGNLYLLPLGTAKLMNRNGLPGCVATDELVEILEDEKQSEDKGLEARMIRAAKMYGIMKGMGFAGAHVGGSNLNLEKMQYIIDEGEKYSNNWQQYVNEFEFPMKKGFYYYKKDKKTKLNTEERVPINRDDIEMRCPFIYHMSHFVHFMMFKPGKNLFGFMRWLSEKCDGTKMAKPYHFCEHFAKTVLYDCKDCGDCGMPNTAYICPMSKCPKNQRNGACGGSRDGWCEVFPGKKKCIYVKAYNRLKVYEEEDSLGEYAVGPCDWNHYQQSSWTNYFLGRDHDGKRLGIPYVPPKKK